MLVLSILPYFLVLCVGNLFSPLFPIFSLVIVLVVLLLHSYLFRVTQVSSAIASRLCIERDRGNKWNSYFLFVFLFK